MADDLQDLLDFGEAEGVSLDIDPEEEVIEEDTGVDIEEDISDMLDVEEEEEVELKPKTKRRNEAWGDAGEKPVKRVAEKPAKKASAKKVAEKPAKKAKEKSAKKAKEQPPKKAKRRGRKKGGKGFLFVIPVMLIAVIAVFAFMNGGGKNGDNYYSGWDKIFKNDAGHFSYVIDVRTQEATGTKSEQQAATLKDAEKMDDVVDEVAPSDEAEVTQPPEEDNSTPTESWTSADGSVVATNEYPNYKITVDGYTIKDDPYTSKYTISIATNEINDVFTEITSFEGNLYVNVEAMTKWLSASKDAYLGRLISSIPENSKFMIIPIDKLTINSGYVEDNEVDSGCITSYPDLVKYFKMIIRGVVQGVHQSVGNTGLSKQGDDYVLNIKGADANKLLSSLKSLVNNRGRVYDSIINQLGGTDEQKAQRKKEKDNFVEACTQLETLLGGETTDLSVTGKTRDYKTEAGVQNIEATVSASFVNNNKDYSITVQAALEGSGQDITKPEGVGSQIDQNLVWDLMRDTTDYFNITGIAMNQQLAIDIDSIQEGIIDDFVEYINSNSSSSINKLTAREFIQKYTNFEVKEDTQELDKKNVELVSAFVSGLTNITGNTVVTTGSASGSSQFNIINTDIADDLRVIATWDTTNSKEKLGVVNVSFVSGKGNKSVDLTKFSLTNAVNSKYPANSETLLKGNDSSFNKDLKKEIAVGQGVQDGVLYFVCSNGVESMSLNYDGKKLGDLVMHK